MSEIINGEFEQLVKPPTKTGIVGEHPLSGPEAVKGETEVRFLNINHNDGQAEKVWEMAKDVDIIYLESAGGTKFYRRIFEGVLNLAASRKFPIFDSIRHQLQEDLEWGGFFNVIQAKAIEAGKTIRLIDVPQGGPGLKEGFQAIKVSEQCDSLLEEGDAVGAFPAFQSFVENSAVSASQRDKYVLKQLKEEVEKGRIGRGKKVAIIQGAAHSAVYHEFKKFFPEIKTERKFPEMPFYYGLFGTLLRNRIFLPDKIISQEDYLRAFLDTIIQPSLKMIDPETTIIPQISLSLMRSLDLNELRSSLTRYGELYQEYRDLVFQQQTDKLLITISKLLPISTKTLTSPQKPLIMANAGAALAKELLKKKGISYEIPSTETNEH